MDNKKPTLGDETRFIFSKNELTDNEFLESINVQISEFGYYKLLSLKKENKGVASNGLLKGSPCSFRFLRSIKYNLLLIEEFVTSQIHFGKDDSNGENHEVASSYLLLMLENLEHLNKHELFPSKKVKAAFNYDICKISDSMVDILTAYLDSEMEHEKFRELCAQNAPQLWLPSLDRDRKPWQQFLHNKAPGSGIEKPFIADNVGSTQAIPWAACRIVKVMNQELQSIYRELPSHKDVYESLVKGPQVTALRPCLSSGRNFRRFKVSSKCMPLDQEAPHWSARENAAGSLENLNQDFTRLCGRRMPVAPRLRDLMVLFVYDCKMPKKPASRRDFNALFNGP